MAFQSDSTFISYSFFEKAINYYQTEIKTQLMVRIKSSVGNQLLVIFNVWMVLVVILKFSLLLFKHWKISVIALINIDLFFLMAMLAFIIFLKGRYNKYIFLNLAIFAASYGLGFILIFFGEDYSIGNNIIQYFLWTYRKILISIITCITIIYIPIDYLYHNKKAIAKYFLSFLICLPISFLYYKNFFLSYRFLFEGENLYRLFSGFLGMNFWALFFIMLHGYLLIIRDRPILGHVNLIIFCFLIFIAIDSIDNYFNFLHKALPVLSQIFLFANLIIFILILVDSFFYLTSEFGKFYEDFKFSKIHLNIKLLQKRTKIDRWIVKLQEYLVYSHYRFFQLFLMIISLILFLYFYPYGYAKISFIILILLITILMFYLRLLVRKRSKIENTYQETLNNQII